MKTFDYETRVLYGDTDQMGVAYYANYFVWFEAARTEFFRALGLPYTECEKKGFFLPAVEASARYLQPCGYDDLLVVRTSVSELGKTSVRFEYEVFDKPTRKKLAEGFTVHVFVNRERRPVRIPEEVRAAVTAHALLATRAKNPR